MGFMGFKSCTSCTLTGNPALAVTRNHTAKPREGPKTCQRRWGEGGRDLLRLPGVWLTSAQQSLLCPELVRPTRQPGGCTSQHAVQVPTGKRRCHPRVTAWRGKPTAGSESERVGRRASLGSTWQEHEVSVKDARFQHVLIGFSGLLVAAEKDSLGKGGTDLAAASGDASGSLQPLDVTIINPIV